MAALSAGSHGVQGSGTGLHDGRLVPEAGVWAILSNPLGNRFSGGAVQTDELGRFLIQVGSPEPSGDTNVAEGSLALGGI